MVVLAVALALPATGSAHRNDDVVHRIDHMVDDTNRLLDEMGKQGYETDLSYQSLTDETALRAVLAEWRGRFKQALKKSYWWDLALCESGGNWKMNEDYHGGLSFHPLTWAAYRGSLPRYAYNATSAEQIRVGRRVQADQGWEAWPYCSKKIGLR